MYQSIKRIAKRTYPRNKRVRMVALSPPIPTAISPVYKRTKIYYISSMMIMLLNYSNPAAVSYQHKMHCSSKPSYLALYDYALFSYMRTPLL